MGASSFVGDDMFTAWLFIPTSWLYWISAVVCLTVHATKACSLFYCRSGVCKMCVLLTRRRRCWWDQIKLSFAKLLGVFFLFLMGQQKNVEPEKTHTLKQTSSDKTVRCNESNQNSFLPTLVWLIPTSSSCHATREFDEIKTEHKDEAHRAQQSRLSWNLTCSV